MLINFQKELVASSTSLTASLYIAVERVLLICREGERNEELVASSISLTASLYIAVERVLLIYREGERHEEEVL